MKQYVGRLSDLPLCSHCSNIAASDKKKESHTILCDAWPQPSTRKTGGGINK